jgi:hypothetical protein
MGTRSITYVYEEDGSMIIALYGQYDGYLSGMGKDLEGFLKPIVVVNGMTRGNERKIANGMGCLAAQLVAHFKSEPGTFRLYPPTTDIYAGQEYEYHIRNSDKGLLIRAETYEGTELYNGLVADFNATKVEEDYDG